MARKTSAWLAPVTIIVVGAALVAALIALKPQPKPRPPTESRPPLVRVIEAESGPRALTVHSQATLAPRRTIELTAQAGGVVTEVSSEFVEGGRFTAGDRLLQIDPRDYRHALARARAQLANAEEALASERGRARQAQREWRDLGNPEANELFLRKPQVAAAEAAVAAAKADLEQAQLNLARATIEAPFTGRVEETLVDLGQYVGPGTRLAQIFESSTAEARLPLTNRQMALLNVRDLTKPEGQPLVTLRAEVAGQPVTWHGRLVRTAASVDRQSRFYHVIAEVHAGEANPPLTFGVFVEAEIQGAVIDEVMVLPRSALHRGDKVYYLDNQLQVVIQPVHVLQANAEKVWITQGPPSGSQVVVRDQALLVEGLRVQILPATDSATPPRNDGQ